jgi:hypothetical protein
MGAYSVYRKGSKGYGKNRPKRNPVSIPLCAANRREEHQYPAADLASAVQVIVR